MLAISSGQQKLDGRIESVYNLFGYTYRTSVQRHGLATWRIWMGE
jgi:hypothetical protein